LQQPDLVGGERLGDHGAEATAAQDLEVSPEIHLGPDRGVHDLFVLHHPLRPLELHGGHARIHRGFLRLVIPDGQGDEQGHRECDPEAFAQDNIIVAQGSLLDHLLVIAMQGRSGGAGRGCWKRGDGVGHE